MYPELDFYCKMGGLTRFWDGYDNQMISWIDDPIAQNDPESIQCLKNIISTGHSLCEVKFGTMVFDSRLIIITTNDDPVTMSNVGNDDMRAAFQRRFSDTCGSFYILSNEQARENLPRLVANCIKTCFDDVVDVDRVIDNMSPANNKCYAHLKL